VAARPVEVRGSSRPHQNPPLTLCDQGKPSSARAVAGVRAGQGRRSRPRTIWIMDSKPASGHLAGMMDDLASRAVADGDDDAIRAILAEVCAITDMGFCRRRSRSPRTAGSPAQVLDKIEFRP